MIAVGSVGHVAADVMLLVSNTSTRTGARRASKLFPGTRLVHGDFHNHTLLSDGLGHPALAFDSMRRAGLDVAAVTDHALYPADAPMDTATRVSNGYLPSLTNTGWRELGELAAQAQRDGSFVALRGFEWTSPRLGHMNVWFSTHFVDTLSTGGYRASDAAVATLPPMAIERAGGSQVFEPSGAPMDAWHRWLQLPVDDGGGLDGLIGFNHPDREPERFDRFAFRADLRERLVSMEIFNRDDDYLLRGVADGNRSPLIECLDAGWRVGLIGVSDDHSANWGFSDGYGRTGLWVHELTRAGVREALLARRVFATRERGFLLDASVNGMRMGGNVNLVDERVRIVVDVAAGAEWWGRRLNLQVLGHGSQVPDVKWAAPINLPRDDEPPITFDLQLRPDETDWLVIRISDPARVDKGGDSATLGNYGAGLAYSSPFFLGRVTTT